MDIAALSVLMNQGSLQQQVGLSVAKLAMDTAKTQGDSLTALAGAAAKSLEMSVQPFLGGLVDFRA